MKKSKKLNKKVNRRGLLKRTAAVAGALAGSSILSGFPTVWAQNIKNVTLRQFGTGYQISMKFLSRLRKILALS